MSFPKLRKYLLILIRFLGRLLILFLVIFLVVTIALQFPSVQTYLTGKITTWASEQTGAEISVERVAIRFPGSIGIKGVYVEDENGDSLLYAGGIFADLRITSLMRNRINIGSLSLEDLTANIIRSEPDSVFNFQFILDAFSNSSDTEELQKEPDQKNDMQLKLNNLKLENIRIVYDDHFPGLRINSKLGYFRASLRHSDFLDGKYHAGRIELNNTIIEILKYEPTIPPTPAKAERQEPDIDIASVILNDIKFAYNHYDGSEISINTKLLNLVPAGFSLQDYMIDIRSLKTEDFNASFISPSGEKYESNNITGNTAADPGLTALKNTDQVGNREEFRFEFAEIMNWTVNVGSLEMENSGISIREKNADLQERYFDPANFSLTGMNIMAKDISAAPDRAEMIIDSLTVLVSENFKVNRLALDLKLGISGGHIFLDIETRKSLLGLSLETGSNLLEVSSDNIGDKNFVLVLEKNHINDDVAFFLPVMNEYYFNWPDNKGLVFGGTIRAEPVKKITADSLWFTGPGFFTVAIQGSFYELPDFDNIYIDLEKFNLQATPAQFLSNMPDSVSPQNINIPEILIAEGSFTGTVNDFETEMGIRSDLGDIQITASMKQEPEKKHGFEGRIITESFDIGKLTQTETISSSPSFRLDFEGRGLEPESMELTAGLNIGNLTIMDYSWDDIDIRAGLKDSAVTVTSSYKDESISVDIDNTIGLFTEKTFINGILSVDYADLRQIGLVSDDLLASAVIKKDLVLFPEDFFNGNIAISNINIAANGEIYSIPELLISSASQPENYQANISSGFVTGTYSGNVSPAGMPRILTSHMSEYLPVTDTINDTDTLYTHFKLDFMLLPDEFVSTVIFPGVEKYDTLTAHAEYDSRLNEIALSVSMEEFEYSGLDLMNFQASMVSDPERMKFDISTDSIRFNETALYDFAFNGEYFEDIFDISFSLKDDEREDLFFIRASGQSKDELFHLNLESDRLIINSEEWKIHPENIIVRGGDSLLINNFLLENRESVLAINTRTDETYNTLVDINFQQFEITSITGFLENLLPVTGGTINGTFTLRDVLSQTSFLADLDIKDLSVSNDTIDMISLKAENPEPDIYNIQVSAGHQGTQVRAEGTYTGGEEPGFDVDVVLEKFNISVVETFTGGSITDISGYVTGEMKLFGAPENPLLTGALNFNETYFRLAALNTGYYLKKETVRFDKHNIHFDDFNLEDPHGSRAQLNGNINFADLNNFVLKLNLVTRNFLIMNLPDRRDELFHGRIIIDSDLRVRGNHLEPALEGSLKLIEGSDFTFKLPQPEPTAIGDMGVVEFIHPETEPFFNMIAERAQTEELVSPVERVNIDLNVELDSQTKLKIVIDDVAGDYLELKGGGVFSLGIRPGGDISLSGRYDIVEGEYLLTFYDVIRRNFRIQPGSNIVWNGDPLEARLDITARYTLRTSARELLRSHSFTDQGQAARLRQQYPFRVYLRMKENMTNPDISFELDMPPEHRSALDGSIMARINEINLNESELNKQVFALLIVGSFIQENPFDFSGGPGLSTTARSSGSQILSQQLNRMSDKYVRGLDVSFELESYEEFDNGEVAGRTELQMEVSRDFMDDRMRITVGGNIELEDETRRRTGAGDIAGDFTLEYLLTPEGDLIIKGFRTRDYGDLIESDITETGISLIFSKSYNKFRELFRRRDREEEEDIPDRNEFGNGPDQEPTENGNQDE